MEDDEGYTVLNLRPKRGNSASPSPAGRQVPRDPIHDRDPFVPESPTSARCYKIALGVLGAFCIIQMLVIALGAWVFQGFSNKGPALKSDGVTQGTGSGRECNASLEDLFFRLKQSLCDPAQISSAGGSGCKLCPREWLLLRDKCYWLSNETKTWNESCDDCSKKGSQMLVIQDWEQMDYLQPVIPVDHTVWIGLTFNSSQREWTWVDGASVHGELVPGLRQAEKNSCGELRKTRIDLETCNTELKWLCQKAAFLL
ncbi:killer cell lectin-like receptor subfamily F member 1 isoform X2 [Chelonia mydas]|uniref:killer cell lectin-like receptor subfamily F member 1 isoform X2 n=1 Tax=Chelonia mydas TaxID=8469 RepID=UPI001CA8B4F8|nr:killer cell lectin-like receptor subfamily F member 1 isoform X2 [Chelonia mydas]